MREAVILKAKELARMAQARGRIYTFLSSVYVGEPSDELIEKILSELFLTSLAEIADGPFLRDLREGAASFDGSHQNLQVEYNSLFTVPLAQYVKPYESAHREGLAGGATTRAVRSFYHKMGGDVSDSFRDLPDHVAAELDFMAYLCDEERKSWRRARNATAIQWLKGEKDFLDVHLSGWIPDLCAEIEAKTETLFYKGLAGFTREFVSADQKAVGELLASVEQQAGSG